MFNLKEALLPYDGFNLRSGQVRSLMQDIRKRNSGDLAPETTADTLIELAVNIGWFQELSDGTVQVVINPGEN